MGRTKHPSFFVMCGIAGTLGIPRDIAVAAAQRMLAAMRHRGPDDQGLVEIPAFKMSGHPIVLAHARLSVLDLTSAGHQPMKDSPPNAKQPSNWIVYNGEVFNFADLHRQLADAGWPCSTRCDTEVILHAYRVWGESCVERFRGMFAWCLLDGDREQAWFCRDRLGIKPLYLYEPASGGLLFASELRTLLAAGADLVRPIVNPSALESFLAQGAVCGLNSIVDGIKLLAPGESLWTDWSGRKQRMAKYWRMPFQADDGQEHQQSERRSSTVARLSQGLRDAVKLRLISDVPLGLFLSGGIDSGVLATVATEVAGTDVESISIGFDQPDFDETSLAARVAGIVGTRHRTRTLTGREVLDDLTTVLAAMDQPTVDGFNVYFVAREARRAGLKVALSGLGGDELFGGYASFQDVPRALRWKVRQAYLGPLQGLLSSWLERTRSRGLVKAAEMLRRDSTAVQMYFLRRELFLPRQRRELHGLPADSNPCSGIPDLDLRELADLARGLDVVNQVSLFELQSYMRSMLLRDADVFSMAHGLELRVPLLDHELVEQVVALPGRYKRPDPRPKPLLLDAVGDRLPPDVYAQPKRGFAFPWGAWLRGPLRDRTEQAISNTDVWSALGLDPRAVRNIWEQFMRRDSRIAALQILALIVLDDFAVRHGLRRAQ